MIQLDQYMDVAVEVAKNFGGSGLELKNVVPAREERMFVVPFGALDDPNDKKAKKRYVGRTYTGADCPGYLTGQLWLNTSDLTPEFKEIARVGEKQTMLPRLFMLSKQRKNQWYTELGRVNTKGEEVQALADGAFNEAGWKNVYPSSTFFDGNLVMPQIWHNLPLVEVEMVEVGDDIEYRPISLVWLKLKPQQMDSFKQAFSAMAKSSPKDYAVQWKLITIANSGEGFSRYSFTYGGASLPEEQRAEFADYANEIVTYAQAYFGNIFKSQHSKGVEDVSTVKDYLVSITNFNDWDAFVTAYDVSAKPIDGKKMRKAGSLKLPD